MSAQGETVTLPAISAGVSATVAIPAATSGAGASVTLTLTATNPTQSTPSRVTRLPASIGTSSVGPLAFISVQTGSQGTTLAGAPGATVHVSATVSAPNGVWMALYDSTQPQAGWNVIATGVTLVNGTATFAPGTTPVALAPNATYVLMVFAPGGVFPSPSPSPSATPTAAPTPSPSASPVVTSSASFAASLGNAIVDVFSPASGASAPAPATLTAAQPFVQSIASDAANDVFVMSFSRGSNGYGVSQSFTLQRFGAGSSSGTVMSGLYTDAAMAEVVSDAAGHVYAFNEAANGSENPNVLVYAAGATTPSAAIPVPLGGFSGTAGFAVDGLGRVILSGQSATPYAAGEGASGVVEIWPANAGSNSVGQTIDITSTTTNGLQIVAADANGNIAGIYSTPSGFAVAEIDYGASAISRTIANAAFGGTSVPSLAYDPTGNLYVSSSGGSTPNAVYVYASRSAALARTITNGASFPIALAVDSKGMLYVANGSPTGSGSGSISIYLPGTTSPLVSIPNVGFVNGAGSVPYYTARLATGS